MVVLDAKKTARALPWPALIESLQEGIKRGCEAPLRHHHNFDIPNEEAGTLLLMPAWESGEYLGVKQVLVIPENYRRDKPAVAASYQLYSAINGELLALIDGGELTNRRTAAASALASNFLSNKDSEDLLMVGAGGLAPYLIQAHCQVRPIKRITIWARNQHQAKNLAESISAIPDLSTLSVKVIRDLDQATVDADIISTATLSNTPLILGSNVRAGTHVDLVGAFTPEMRESDDALIAKASLFADTFLGASTEAGDYIQPFESGVITKSDILADLHMLARGAHTGRASNQEITVFKSTGTALEDLAAAVLAFRSVEEDSSLRSE